MLFYPPIYCTSDLNWRDKKIEDTVKKYIPTVTFAEIGGLGDTITIIREVIELPIKQPQLFKHLGIKPHKGILLYGDPGCGKTLIAKAIANEINAHFRDIKASELFSKWVGQSEANLRAVFNEARELEPSIIFFDEIDAMARERSGDEAARFDSPFVNQLLTLMDGVEEYANVRIIASTNRPDIIDKALLRPGRFDYKIEIKKPTLQGCWEIFRIYTENMPVADDINEQSIVNRCYEYGYTGADIAYVIRESAYNCMRRNININDVIHSEQKIEVSKFIISQKDFELALVSLREKKQES